MQQIWLNSSKTEEEFDLLRDEIPNCKLSYRDLDRSTIPALPDTLITEGVGFGVFLKVGKTSQKLPKNAVGVNAGPALMSYGRALDMFGMPDGPGENPPDMSGSDAKASVEDSMAQCVVTQPAPALSESSEPKSELDYRQIQGPRTPALLSEKDQWALFDSRKFMGDAAVLAQQYAKLVREKEGQEGQEGQKGKKDKKDKESDDSLTTESLVPNSSKDLSKSVTTDPVVPTNSEDAVTQSDEWPFVEKLDWEGFTNWISRCREADKSFGRVTLKEWRKQRENRRATIAKKLAEWKPPKNSHEESTRHPNPRKFYTGRPLAIVDAEKLGLKLNK